MGRRDRSAGALLRQARRRDAGRLDGAPAPAGCPRTGSAARPHALLLAAAQHAQFAERLAPAREREGGRGGARALSAYLAALCRARRRGRRRLPKGPRCGRRRGGPKPMPARPDCGPLLTGTARFAGCAAAALQDGVAGARIPWPARTGNRQPNIRLSLR